MWSCFRSRWEAAPADPRPVPQLACYLPNTPEVNNLSARHYVSFLVLLEIPIAALVPISVVIINGRRVYAVQHKPSRSAAVALQQLCQSFHRRPIGHVGPENCQTHIHFTRQKKGICHQKHRWSVNNNHAISLL